MRNWNEVAPALLERARREAVGGVMDLTTAELVHRLRTGADAAVLGAPCSVIALIVPVVHIEFSFGGGTLRWFSIISTIGTPVDITAQELRAESFVPSDQATAERWRQLSGPGGQDLRTT